MAKRTFAQMMQEYPTYDPHATGYGTPDDWQRAFQERMGYATAKKIVGKRSPWELLGLTMNATLAQAKTAFRKLAMLKHPDRTVLTGLSKEQAEIEFKELLAAYTVIERILS